jgi:8-amino-7-oxononanoate synthase
MLAKLGVTIWMDEATYPIARWGSDRAAALGVPIHRFAHHNAHALERALDRAPVARPVIVTDGYCPVQGTHAPLLDYASFAAARNGLLIVDDTQALGVFGRREESINPYGSGGGGSLQYFNLRNPGVVLVSSLAKAFGVPVAMLGGSEPLVESFRGNSATLMHCSPPSAAVISATHQALQLNERMGDSLRRRLSERVVRFRRTLLDLQAVSTLFPVQPLKLPGGTDTHAFHRDLLSSGIQSVLHRDSSGGGPRISFLLTERHRLSEIDYAVTSLADLIRMKTSSECARSFH